MIGKNVFERDFEMGMLRELQAADKKAGMAKLDHAGELLISALDIFEQAGMKKQADAILTILNKIANPDPHVKGLTPAKMTENLKNHGTVFNMADDGTDLLNADMGGDLEVVDRPEVHDFEEEAD